MFHPPPPRKNNSSKVQILEYRGIIVTFSLTPPTSNKASFARWLWNQRFNKSRSLRQITFTIFVYRTTLPCPKFRKRNGKERIASINLSRSFLVSYKIIYYRSAGLAKALIEQQQQDPYNKHLINHLQLLFPLMVINATSSSQNNSSINFCLYISDFCAESYNIIFKQICFSHPYH